MNKDGKMDRLEFSIAMKLIKLKLQGTSLPSALPIIMKQPPVPAPTLNNPISSMTNPGYGNTFIYYSLFLLLIDQIPNNIDLERVTTACVGVL